MATTMKPGNSQTTQDTSTTATFATLISSRSSTPSTPKPAPTPDEDVHVAVEDASAVIKDAAAVAEDVPTEAENIPEAIAADEAAGFSDYDDSASEASSTQSLTSSTLDHVYANGRRYHRRSADENNQYLMPSDETEMDRLDMMHHMALLLLDGELHKAPITDDPPRVLDCGTGTGIWALDFGSIHPASHVVGVDLAPNQPSWTYPNVQFETDDLEKTWTFKKNHFNFIHSRMVGTAIKDWGRYTQQMFDHLAPNGYIELSEHSIKYAYCDDSSVPSSSILLTHGELLASAIEKTGVRPRDLCPSFFHTHLAAAGFTDIQVYTYKVPCGPWPKSKRFKYIGAVCAEGIKTGLEAYGMLAMTRLLGMQEEVVREMCEKCYRTIMEGREHPYYFQWQIVARKPDVGEVSLA
ncbi:S-adenosyl-L-methionine-dependent methyltransferase [Ascodesmis nigricans]|uniref:S-adenosyl-L-methionine-dependent methyltransferase n=1 Tax=Ascodesmis nigricans TaxID=341454 RepID=A0A4S2MRC2_9PEZI|nr:S-adenosyl-L-methionine-dependent methyltransferase [Ascodesmis nigricans]